MKFLQTLSSMLNICFLAITNYINLPSPFIICKLRIRFLLVLFFTAITCSMAQTHIQTNTNFQLSTLPIISCTFAAPSTAGNLIVVHLDWDGQTRSIFSVIDNKGNIYRKINGPTNWDGTNYRSELWYAYDITGGGGNITLIAVLTGAPTSFSQMYISEYSGIISTTDPLDQNSVATGNSGTVSSGSKNTTWSKELIYGASIGASGALTTGAGFTNRSIANQNIIEDKNVTATGSYNAAFTSAGGNWIAQMATFYAAPVFTTGTIIGSPFCAGTNVSVPFTIDGTFATPKVFTAQLSDASGFFAAPVSIGTLSSLSSGTIAATIPAGTAAGTGYRIRVVCSNPSFTGTDNGSNLTINSVPATPGTITQPANKCSGSTGNTFSIAAVSGATSYNWSVTGTGWAVTAGGTTTSATITIGSGTGTVSVTATNGCGTSTAASTGNIIPTTIPATPGTITQPANKCSGSTGNTFSIAAVSGATSYTWSVTGTGWAVTAGGTTTSATITIGTGTGTVSVTATNGCGTTTAASTGNIIPTVIPATPGVISGLATQCSALNGQVYSITAVPNATSYIWTVPTGWTITAGSTTSSITVTTGSAGQNGNINVTASNGCGTSAASTFAVTVNTPPTITPNKVDETCPTSNNGSISPVLSGGITNVRYIKLTQKYVNGAAWQQVQEIQAFEIFTGTNVALASNGASATSSSIYLNNVTTFGPQKAIDGDFTGYSFWHSNSTNTGEWIKVDLTSAKNIDYLRIYNRVDCCQERGQNMLLELFDASNNLVYSKKIDLYQSGANVPVIVNVLDVSWADAATSLNRSSLPSGTYTLNYADAAGCSVSEETDIAPPANNVWNGSVSADWNDPLNWCAGVPTNGVTNTLNVVIPSSGVTNYPIIYAGATGGYVKTLVLESNTTLNIIDNSLQVTDNLKLDGKIDLEGEAQLLQDLGSTLDPSSSGTLERDQQGTADKYTYNYWSSPVGVPNNSTNNNPYKLPDVIKNIGFLTSGYDGTASPLRIADYWIWKFSNKTSGDYSQWQHVRSTGTMLIGEGFTMKGPGTGTIPALQNYVFEGKPNNGDINLTISSGNDYLVGNPYPSALDADQFINDNYNVDGTGSTTGPLYFWQHWGGGSHILAEYQGGYATYSLVGGVGAPFMGSPPPGFLTTPGRYIPVAQGFFVVAETSGTINFNNGQRVFQTEGTNSVFIKSYNPKTTGKQAEDTRTKIRLGLNSVNRIQRELLVTVDPITTPGYDWGYDAPNIDTQIDDMYWLIDTDKYVIQATDQITDETILPIGIHVRNDGNNSISINKLENTPDNLMIFVHDKELNSYHNLKDRNYEVFLLAGDYLDRFEVTFGNSNALDINDVSNEAKIDVLYSNEKHSIIIQNPDSKEIRSVEMYNVLGQMIFNYKTTTNERYITYSASHIQTGAYILKIVTENGTLTKKVLVN